MENQLTELAHKLAECILACNNCINGCLKEEDVKMMAECIRTDKQCLEICTATLSLIQEEDSDLIRDILTICKNSCHKCEQECRKYHHDHCQKCADACKACAEECSNRLNEISDGEC